MLKWIEKPSWISTVSLVLGFLITVACSVAIQASIWRRAATLPIEEGKVYRATVVLTSVAIQKGEAPLFYGEPNMRVAGDRNIEADKCYLVVRGGLKAVEIAY